MKLFFLAFLFLVASCAKDPSESPSISGRFEGPIGSMEFFADKSFFLETRGASAPGTYSIKGSQVTLKYDEGNSTHALDILPTGSLITKDGHVEFTKVESIGESMFIPRDAR